jgi:hypothetical protein
MLDASGREYLPRVSWASPDLRDGGTDYFAIDRLFTRPSERPAARSPLE